MDKTIEKKFKTLASLVGNTPMIGIKYRYKGKDGIIYTKLESYNFTGSSKDRIALYILKEAYKEGLLQPGKKIIEATSGNTGISISAMGRMLGHEVCIVMPDWMSVERKLIIQSYGAKIISISKEQGGFLGSIRLCEETAGKDSNVFLPCQFSNPNNPKSHEITGVEIISQLQRIGLRPQVFIAGVGTGGTVTGVGKTFRSKYNDVKIHPMEPEESPTLSTGYKIGSHRIQGISDEFIPEIIKRDNTLDDVVQVSDGDAILMAQNLLATFGLGVGISSGANLIGAIKLQEEYGKNVVTTTVFPDCNKKYLSTDLTKTEKIKDTYLTPHIELLEFICITDSPVS